MPQLLLEILSEEIPARMQAKAQADLERALMDGLTAAGLMPEGVKGFSGPRRLTVVVDGLPIKSADVSEDIQGPKEGAPEAAIQGFVKKAGLKSIAEAHLHDVPKKGRIYVAHVRKPGRETAGLIADLVPAIIRGFHWPKSMRWASGDLRWVRPISRILCTFDGEVVPFEIEGIKSGNWTEGHRVLGRGPYQVKRFDDYEEALRTKGAIVLDREQRKEIILSDARQLCAAQNLELVEDLGLLEEVAGLAEHPVVIIGDMDPAFLDLPPEVIRLSMRTHQKYFAVRDPAKKDGGLAPKFIVVANLTASDGGAKIAQGNSRVLSARLNDARFFWDNDRKVSLESRFEKLGQIVFHEKLGTVKDKAERVMALAKELAPKVGADPADAERAAKLAKCDLVSDMVGEFAELEGVMGRYYALMDAGYGATPPPSRGQEAARHLPPSGGGLSARGEGTSSTRRGEVDAQRSEADGGGLSALSEARARAIADAVRDHYKPKGPSDEVPNNPVSVAVALADKLDTLVGFWAIDEKPTGSKDPFALRRAALGFIRTTSASNARLKLRDIIYNHICGCLSRIEGGIDELADSFRAAEESDSRFWELDALHPMRQADDFIVELFNDLNIENEFERPAWLDRYFLRFEKKDRIGAKDAFAAFVFIVAYGEITGDTEHNFAKSICGKDGWAERDWPSEISQAVRDAIGEYFEDLLAFFADRLKVHLREQGARHDLIDAVFALGEDDLVLIVKRVEALGAFLDSEDGKNLLAGSKRAANILKAEEKKDGEGAFNADPDPKLFKLPEEKALHAALAKAAPAAREAVGKEDFAAAMRALSALRGPVDAFFDKVTVNDADLALRKNRLCLLAQIRSSLGAVADFSKIEG